MINLIIKNNIFSFEIILLQIILLVKEEINIINKYLYVTWNNINDDKKYLYVTWNNINDWW